MGKTSPGALGTFRKGCQHDPLVTEFSLGKREQYLFPCSAVDTLRGFLYLYKYLTRFLVSAASEERDFF